MTDFKPFTQTIRSGGTVLFPTENFISLGCDPCSNAAVEKIMAIIKPRDKNSFVILVDDIRWVEKFIPDFPEVCYDLVELSVEPLTIIYPNAKGLASQLLLSDGSVGIRVTKDPFCQAYLRALRGPLLSTSTILSAGEKSPAIKNVPESICKQVDYVLDDTTWQSSGKSSKTIKIGLNSQIEIIP